jgi:2'-5' RNA ligase
MSSLVIVAIPAEDDIVWKVSSEKVPHLTLMYLGETTDDNTAQRMADFVEHALNINEHGPFYLDVDYRGELGPDQADVLYFCNGWDSKWIKSLRGQLLKQNDIRAAFEANDQFPEWVPHLTLGYPTAPANDIPDDRKIYSVQFDRIAVWTGDYSGPEFRLKWPDRDPVELAVAYSEYGPEVVGDILKHAGVKGMKWGVRKDKVTAGLKSAGRGLKSFGKGLAIGIGDHLWQQQAYSAAAQVNIHNAMADHFNEGITKINAKPQYQVNLNERKNAKILHDYDKEVTELQHASYEHAAKAVLGKNVSGSKEGFYDRKSGTIVIRPTSGGHGRIKPGISPLDTSAVVPQTVRVEHANDDVTLKLKVDSDGKIVQANYAKLVDLNHAMELGEEFVLSHASVLDDAVIREQIKAKVQSILDDVTGDADKDLGLFGDPLIRTKLQSVLDDFYRIGVDKAMAYSALGEAYVEHFGIKGMKWGFRKDRPAPTAVAPTASSKVPHGDRRKTKIEAEGGQNHPAHEDAIKVAKAQAKLKKSGPAALSNQELRDMATRLNLENQVGELTKSRGRKFIQKHLTGQTDALAREGLREGVKQAPRVGRAAGGVRTAARVAALPL